MPVPITDLPYTIRDNPVFLNALVRRAQLKIESARIESEIDDLNAIIGSSLAMEEIQGGVCVDVPVPDDPEVVLMPRFVRVLIGYTQPKASEVFAKKKAEKVLLRFVSAEEIRETCYETQNRSGSVWTKIVGMGEGESENGSERTP